MKIVQINALYNCGSTGKIVFGISRLLDARNIENYVLYTKQSPHQLDTNSFYCGNKVIQKTNSLVSHLFGCYGFEDIFITKKIIKKLEQINPDIVHLHNLHSHDVNIWLLLEYLLSKRIKVVWTFHDCWTFTGYCPHFTMTKCDKWKTTCGQCPLRREYSWFFDKSKKNFERKKKAFLGLDLTIVTPSKWLAGLVKESFLQDYPIRVINNGIDLSVFKPTKNSFRINQGLEDKKVLLGVADMWGKRKGLDVFVELSKRLPDDYRIVLVGTTDAIDEQLPSSILSIHRTQNQEKLAEIYTAADLFVNPTREEVLGLVNLEALACGTPVITFNSGGSPECIDTTCGSVVGCDDISALVKEILKIYRDKPYSKEACMKRAKSFDAEDRFKEYIELYERL